MTPARLREVIVKLRCHLLSFLAVAVGLLLPVGLSADTGGSSGSWLGVYLQGQKMGYMHLTVSDAKYKGRSCKRVESVLRTRLVLLRANLQQDIRTTIFADERFTPYFETFETESGGRKTTVEATFTPKEVKCKVISDSSTSSKVVPIPAGASLVGDTMYALGMGDVKVGQKTRMFYFNQVTLAVDPIDVEVLRQEEIEVKGRKYDTFVIKNATPMGDTTSWQTKDGALIKSVSLLGLTMQVESETEAKSGVDSNYMPPVDLAVMTSVKANIDIPKPEKVHRLVVKLIGNLDPKMAISDNWQAVKRLEPVDGQSVYQFIIQPKPFDTKRSILLPADKAFANYLNPTAYLDSDSPEVKAKAAEIVNGERSTYAAASKIRAWVSANMKPRADMGIARPGGDVLKEKSGVCRDYAILSASLMRAAGIPTKVIAGLVYINGGFYYHAWNECYVGEWVAFDATLGREFVDATHIKLAEGDATNMFEIASVFGSLKAAIIEFK